MAGKLSSKVEWTYFDFNGNIDSVNLVEVKKWKDLNLLTIGLSIE